MKTHVIFSKSLWIQLLKKPSFAQSDDEILPYYTKWHSKQIGLRHLGQIQICAAGKGLLNKVHFTFTESLHTRHTHTLGGSEKERKGGRNVALVSSCDVCLSPGSRSPGCCQSNRTTTRNGWRGCLHACPFDFLNGKSLAFAKAGFFDRL